MQFEIKKHLVTKTAGGAQYFIQSYHFNNNPGGKTFYIQANVHGIEIAWIPVIYELMDYIEKNNSQINIICVPKANPFWMDSQIMWVQTWYNNIHTNGYNCLNYNRIWANNSYKFEDTIISTLLEISKDADVVLDCHSAGLESLEHIYVHEKFISQAKIFNIDNILSWQEAGNAFEDVCFSRGQTAFTLEMWASRTADMYRTQYFLERILFYFWLENNISNFNTNIRTWQLDDMCERFYSEYEWVLLWNISLWDEFKKWDILAYIYTTDDGKKEIFAPADWVFLIKFPIHAVFKFQEIAQLMLKK